MTDSVMNIDDLGTYSDGYLAGATWGINHATAQLDERDEHLARRINALLLQHDRTQQLVASVLATLPHADRGIRRARTQAELDAILHVAPFEDRP
jgi:hypothetical protein